MIWDWEKKELNQRLESKEDTDIFLTFTQALQRLRSDLFDGKHKLPFEYKFKL